MSTVLFNNDSCNTNTLNIEENEKNSFIIYPNPVRSRLTINSKTIIESMKIINHLGQVVFSEKLNETSKSIDLTKLKSGIYYLKIKFSDGHKSVKKVIKI